MSDTATRLAVDTGVKAGEPPWPHPAYAWYVVMVLVIAYTFSFIDRQILSLLVVPMKQDLNISDTQMSLLQGFAFALFYTLMGLPIGRMVDTRHRIRIIAVGIFFWSLMTALCGVARHYWQLFVFRMGVGVGEAALSPAAYSLISDYFRPHRIGVALGVYGMGVYIGAGLALVIGGIVIRSVTGGADVILPVVGEIRPWQLVFFIVGLPGFIVALWALTLREPKRRGLVQSATATADASGALTSIPLAQVLSYMNANRLTLFCVSMCYALVAMMAYGVAAWIPTFFIRTHGWTAGDAGIVYGFIIVVFGTAGVVCGGWMGDVLSARGIRSGRMWVMTACAVLSIPFALAYPLVEDATTALIILMPSTFFATFVTGAGPSAIPEIAPNQMRGFVAAVIIFVVNIIGLGVGPTAIAVVTDYVFQDESMLNYSLAIVPTIILVLAAVVGFMGIAPYARSRDHLDAYIEKQQITANNSE